MGGSILVNPHGHSLDDEESIVVRGDGRIGYKAVCAIELIVNRLYDPGVPLLDDPFLGLVVPVELEFLLLEAPLPPLFPLPLPAADRPPRVLPWFPPRPPLLLFAPDGSPGVLELLDFFFMEAPGCWPLCWDFCWDLGMRISKRLSWAVKEAVRLSTALAMMSLSCCWSAGTS